MYILYIDIYVCVYSKASLYRYPGTPFIYGIPVNSQEQLILL